MRESEASLKQVDLPKRDRLARRGLAGGFGRRPRCFLQIPTRDQGPVECSSVVPLPSAVVWESSEYPVTTELLVSVRSRSEASEFAMGHRPVQGLLSELVPFTEIMVRCILGRLGRFPGIWNRKTMPSSAPDKRGMYGKQFIAELFSLSFIVG